VFSVYYFRRQGELIEQPGRTGPAQQSEGPTPGQPNSTPESSSPGSPGSAP
jgi:hypothetical protein